MDIEILYFCLIVFGITNVFCFLHVGHWFRFLVGGCWDDDFEYWALNDVLSVRQSVLGRLVRCHACFGFWVGFGLSMGGLGPFWDVNMETLMAIANGFLASAFNFILWVILKKLGVEEL